jgi:hypothetical protein
MCQPRLARTLRRYSRVQAAACQGHNRPDYFVLEYLKNLDKLQNAGKIGALVWGAKSRCDTPARNQRGASYMRLAAREKQTASWSHTRLTLDAVSGGLAGRRCREESGLGARQRQRQRQRQHRGLAKALRGIYPVCPPPPTHTHTGF